jgi:hypothetical protein
MEVEPEKDGSVMVSGKMLTNWINKIAIEREDK